MKKIILLFVTFYMSTALAQSIVLLTNAESVNAGDDIIITAQLSKGFSIPKDNPFGGINLLYGINNGYGIEWNPVVGAKSQAPYEWTFPTHKKHLTTYFFKAFVLTEAMSTIESNQLAVKSYNNHASLKKIAFEEIGPTSLQLGEYERLHLIASYDGNIKEMLTSKDVEIRLTTPTGKNASNLAELIFRNGRGYLLKGKQTGTVYVHANYNGVKTVKTINIFDPYN